MSLYRAEVVNNRPVTPDPHLESLKQGCSMASVPVDQLFWFNNSYFRVLQKTYTSIRCQRLSYNDEMFFDTQMAEVITVIRVLPILYSETIKS